MKLQKEAYKRYRNVLEEENDKKLQYARGQFENLSEEEKEKKYQYGQERYKNFLEDDYRNIFSRMQEIKTI